MASRFAVTDVEIEVSEDQPQGQAQSTLQVPGAQTEGKMDHLKVGRSVEGSGAAANIEANQLTVASVISGNLALYEEELESRPRIARVLSTLVPVDGVVAPNMEASKKSKKKKKANLGTIMGVYLPTVQNILGVILFIRLPWIVGVAGVGMSFFLVALCCTATFLTAVSLSAIATNGHVPAGGSYFMISRNLGPEFGGAVGILFYLANTFGASLYIVGAVEILVTYIVPEASLFGEVRGNPGALFNNIRVYGTILLILLALIVFVGVKIVNWFATFCLVAVIIAVVSIYAGALNPVPRVNICTINGTALQGPLSCNPDIINMTEAKFENDSNATLSVCSTLNVALRTSFKNKFFFLLPNSDNETIREAMGGNWTQPPTCEIGIPGITRSITIVENGGWSYLRQGEVRPDEDGVTPQITASIGTSFLVLIGIFFPSVTGIMAGSNRSGDLRDAQKSIPIGTLAAIGTTTLIYLTCVLFFGSTIRRFLLLDQFGNAAGLTVSLLAWPTRWIILIGSLSSTLGAALQTLTGAPRLMQAIANDNLIGFLTFFKRTGLNGEPSFALLLTALLSEVGILIASLDLVAPILTMFFLICYMFVNFACVLQSILKAPNWRPRFRYYHWVTSLVGALLCLILMFLVSWYYALVALILAAIIYKYIEYRGAEKEWGDGVRGLSLQAARYALLKLEEGPTHTKNWRPQMLVLCKLDPNLLPSQPKQLSFASQLKAGKGLMMVHSVLEGSYADKAAEVIAAKQTLKRFTEDNGIEGFVKVIAARDIQEGLSQVIQSAGLGGMKHNSVLLCWPDSWRKNDSWKHFIECVRVAATKQLAVLLLKGINWFPSNKDRMKEHIDVWWVVNDGGLLMLLPFLLRQHKVWKHCKLRIFTVAQMGDNSIKMKKDLVTVLYQLRISAEVDVIEMPDTSISAYTYERTLMMEQRNQMLEQMKLTRRQKRGDVQHLLGRSFSVSHAPPPDLHRTASGVEEISIPVPQIGQQTASIAKPHQATSTIAEEADTVSIGELSVEPRVLGDPHIAAGTQPGPVELIDLTTPYPTAEDAQNKEEEDGGVVSAPKRHHSDSESSSDGEDSAHTPLLEAETSKIMPIMSEQGMKYDNIFTQRPTEEEIPLGGSAKNLTLQPQEENLMRMNTSVKLNEIVVQHSHKASLVIINLPGPPSNPESDYNYLEFLEVLTEGLDRVLMVRGGGSEVVTIYS